MSLVIILFSLAFGLCAINFLKKEWKLYKLNIPVLGAYPLFIELFYPVTKLALMSSEQRFQKIAEICLAFPDMMKLWLGPKLVIFVNRPDRIQKVLMSSKCLEKWNMFYELMDRDRGLIAASVIKAKWKEHRKIFNHSFSLKNLESFVPIFIEFSDNFCEIMATELGKGEFDFFTYCKKLSFDMLSATTLGTNIKAFRKNPLYEQIFDAYELTEAAMNQKFTIPYIYPKTFYKLTKMYRDEKKAQKILDDFQKAILDDRRVTIQREHVSNNNDNDKQSELNTLIDHIILNEANFSPEEIRDHILTFVSAYETWANFVSHTMLLLAIHGDIQDRLYKEIEECIHSEQDLKNTDLIAKMQYLDMVQKEALRLMPTVPMILRETLEDFEMEPNLVIPKHTNLVLNFYALHRQESIWGKEAHKFNPDNFLPERAEKRHPFSFLPFSAGPRICIGYKYSNISIKIVLIKFLMAFKFSTSIKLEDINLKSYISLKLCGFHQMSIERRNKTNFAKNNAHQ